MNKIFLKIISIFSVCMFMFNFDMVGEAHDSNGLKVSIIVPVYKVEKWLPECMDSLINQTLKEIEIICIDDGSPDNCGKILDDYSEKDERVKVIHQDNQGVSAARNAGLDVASGEYITFVDPDDFIHPLTCEIAYEYAKKDDVDALRFNFRTFKDGEDSFDVNDIDLSDAPVLSLKDYWNKTWANNVCNHFFRYELIQDDNIRFNKGMWYAEDTCFNFMSMAKLKKIKYIPGKFYNYRRRAGSATTMDKRQTISNSIQIFKSVCDHWRKNKCLDNNQSLLLMVLIRWMSNLNSEYFFEFSDQILNSFGSDVYNKEVVKKLPKQIKKIIRKLEQTKKNKKLKEKKCIAPSHFKKLSSTVCNV